MAIQYMDGFQIYGNVTSRLLETGAWAGFTTFADGGLNVDPSGETTDYVLKIINDGDANYRITLPTPRRQIGVAQRIFLNSLPTNNNRRVVFSEVANASNELLYSWVISPTGQVQLIQGFPDTYVDRVTVAQTPGPIVGAGVWTHMETFNDLDTGEYECRVEGLTVLSGVDPAPPTPVDAGLVRWSEFWFYNEAPGFGFYIKDLIIRDASGTQNTDFVGPVTIYTLPVDGDVSSGWTGSAPGPQFELIDELAPDDATYISAGDPPPAPAIFTFQNLPVDVVAVRALQPVVRRRKTDGGEGQMQVTLISDGDRDEGANEAVTVSFAYQWDISQTDPATAGLWTPAAVDAATLEINRTV